MSASILRGLARFVGLVDQPPPVHNDPDRIGYLIVNEEQFVHAFQHLGRKHLRTLLKLHGTETYSMVHPEALVSFLETLIDINPTSKSGEKIHLLLETVVRILAYQRDRHDRVMSLYSLMDSLGLSNLIRLYADASIPKTLREALGKYLEALPGYRDAMFFDEGIPVGCYTHHQVYLKPIQNAANVLDKRALSWLKRELDVAGALVKEEGGLLEAHRQAKYLIVLNRSYWIIEEEDLVAQLMLRGFSDKLYAIISKIKD